MSPTTIFTRGTALPTCMTLTTRGREVYPGYGMTGSWVGTREGYTGTHPVPSQDTIFSIF